MVPHILQNSVGATKFIIDADPLNENFQSLADGSAIEDGTITPSMISSGVTDFLFPGAVGLGITTSLPPLQEGIIFCKREPDGSSAFYGVNKDSSGNLQYVML